MSWAGCRLILGHVLASLQAASNQHKSAYVCGGIGTNGGESTPESVPIAAPPSPAEIGLVFFTSLSVLCRGTDERSQVTGVAFSDDERFVATASEDRTVRVTFL